MRQAVFLDRDGTLNRNDIRDGKPYGPARLADFQFLPGVADALARFRETGFATIVVTNQPALSAGGEAANIVRAMHSRLRSELSIDDIFACPHPESVGCDCRKPKPGLFYAAASKWDIDLRHSIMVGDRWRDIDAGRAAGCLTVHIYYGYTGEPAAAGSDLVVSSLAEAAEWICGKYVSSED